MPAPAAVCFDLFDTLVDQHMDRLPRVALGDGKDDPGLPSTVGALHRAVREHAEIELAAVAGALREVDREIRDPRYREGRELPTLERFTALVARLGIEAPELPARLTEVHMGLLRDVTEVPAHHVRVLRELRRRVPLALCSNFSHTPTALGVLEQAGLREHFDTLVVSEDVGLRKPRREIFEAVTRGLGLAPESNLHVGDNLRADVGGAAALGMRTAWLVRRIPDQDAARRGYEGPAPDFVLSDVSEVELLLGGGSST
jgi:FMN phosphatase YigB (HAD superfamily)